MKGVAIREHGDLNVVRLEELSRPQIKPDEVLVKVLCAGLNHLDIWVRKGRPGTSLNAPHVLGSDAVGVIENVGSQVKNVQAGDAVVVYPGLSCGHCQACEAGERSLCPSFQIVGLNRAGTYAQYVALPASNVFPRPKHLTDEEAGGFLLANLTAWRMLMTRAKAMPGETILIHGIGGGVAVCGLQWAKLLGLETIVTSSSDEKLSRAVRLGADQTINYKKEDVADRVKNITNGRGVDIAFDTVGAATWALDLNVLHKGGRVVLCGITTGATAETNLQAIYWNQLTVLGSTLGSIDFHDELAKRGLISGLFLPG